MNKWKNSWYWYIYDFGNSFAAVLGGVYFSKWFIEDLGNGAFEFNMLLFIGAVFVILGAPFVGKLIDGGRLWITFLFTTFGAGLSLALIVLFAFQITESRALTVAAGAAFCGFLICYQSSRICHNAYLRLVIPEEDREAVSGHGAAFNWLGSIFGIAASIPIVSAVPGVEGRHLVFVMALIGFVALSSLALWRMTRPSRPASIDVETGSPMVPWAWYFSAWALAVFFLYDAMSTIQRNLPPYLSEVYGLDDQTQGIAFLLILTLAAIGGFFAARFVKFGNTKTWIIFPGVLLIVAIFLLTFVQSNLFWLAFPLAGFAYGVLESSIRLSLMAEMPTREAGARFAILAAVERSAGVAGPLIWSSPFLFNLSEPIAARSAMFMMGLLVLMGILIFAFSRSVSVRRAAD